MHTLARTRGALCTDMDMDMCMCMCMCAYIIHAWMWTQQRHVHAHAQCTSSLPRAHAPGDAVAWLATADNCSSITPEEQCTAYSDPIPPQSDRNPAQSRPLTAAQPRRNTLLRQVDSVGECRALECHVVLIIERDPSVPPAASDGAVEA
jgi:hypothetical protein